jgi:hypothetical protein
LQRLKGIGAVSTDGSRTVERGVVEPVKNEEGYS